MSLCKMYLFLFIIVCLVSVTCFCVEINQMNEFSEYIDHEIEIHGGLTSSAVHKIDAYNQKNLKGSYRLESQDLHKKKRYGEQVNYKINKNFKFLFIDLGDNLISLNGSAVSHSR